MRTSVQLRVGRVTRRTWAFPALAVAAVLPHLILLCADRMGDLPWTDAWFWTLVAGCVVAPAAFLGGIVAGVRTSGRGPRIGLAFAVAACLAVSGELLVMTTETAGLVGKNTVRMVTVVPPMRRAMRVPAAEAARRAFDAGDPAFLGLSGIFGRNAPVVQSCALRNRYGMVVMDLGWFALTNAEQRFSDQASEYAEAYNRAMAGYLHLSAAELASDGRCTTRPHIRTWPGREEIPR
jgi:hypothetical protein